MELIDTPNPNAKKLLTKNFSSLDFHNENTQSKISRKLQNVEGVTSVFFWSRFFNNNKS